EEEVELRELEDEDETQAPDRINLDVQEG
ncbi:DNA-directed RNA polymerase beta subunit (EC 2.7.7.6), partial [Terribacillus sp. AE2B 122]